MLRFVYISLLAMGSALGRDPLRARPMPTISNSLVNLGKMDITFYIGKENGGPAKETVMPISPKHLPIIDECLCNSFRSSNDPVPFGGSSSIINKILSSNDLFNINKDVTYGPQCCESHEENTITFEFGPKPLVNAPKTIPFQPLPPIVFDSFFPPQKSFAQSPVKPKAIEIFLFPKNKDGSDNKSNKFWMNNFTPKKSIKKEIKIVGDKDIIKNTFDTKNNDVKNSYDIKYFYDTKNVNDAKMLKSVKSSFDFKSFDNLKYETVTPVTTKKEIGIKDTEDDSKPDEKDESRKDMTNVSKTQTL